MSSNTSIQYSDTSNPEKKYYETIVDISKHPEYCNYTTADWVTKWLDDYGNIDGSHHKAWSIDQAMQILKGTKIIVYNAHLVDGTIECRCKLDIPSNNYLKWKRLRQNDGYTWNTGCPP